MTDEPAGCEVVATRSGARAVRDRATGELMHPVVGPRLEARSLYVAPSRLAERLAQPADAPLLLLDVGLGAGSNAIAAWRTAHAMAPGARRLALASFDRTRAALALALRPEHAADFELDGAAGEAARAVCDRGRHDDARTAWWFVDGELPDALAAIADATADIVFWDPFSPRANPGLWTAGAFRALRRACRAGATVHTYSGATATRSALLLAGFCVGLGGTTDSARQTTIAAVDLADLAQPLDRRWLERVRRSSAPLPVDAPPDALDQLAACAQFAEEARAGGE